MGDVLFRQGMSAVIPQDSLRIESRGENMWEFSYPRLTQVIYEYFDEAIDAWREGRNSFAEYRYIQLFNDYPEFIDAYHHLALLYDDSNRADDALALWKRSVQIGLDALPEQVVSGKGRLPWLFLDNRPFLRAYHAWILKLRESNQVEQALELCQTLLGWNPDDNQGIRILAIDYSFHLNRPQNVLEICQQYHNDGMDGVLYGHALANIQLGHMKEARAWLADAITQYPLIARELIKTRHRKPVGLHPDRVALWSPEQAYMYWKEQGSYWMKTPDALNLVREVIQSLPDLE